MSKAATADSYSKNMLHQKVFRTIICILFCIIALLPFVLLVMNATRDSESIKAGVSLIPSTHLIENWKNLMIKQNGMQITLQKAIINSATITIPGTFLSVYFSSLTAYGIHVYDFKFKKFAWAFIMAVMMVPSQISIIGFYRFMLDLKLIDTYVPLIIPTIAAPTVVFFMKQYMESTLSLEMIEAARIDGSKEWNTFNKIILPIMKPAVYCTVEQPVYTYHFADNRFQENTSYVCTAAELQPVPYGLWCSLCRTVCYHYPSGCCIPGTFQVHRRRCCTWRC